MHEIDAIRARRAAVSDAPWQIHDIDPAWVANHAGAIIISACDTGNILTPAQAAFIAAAPADIATLLAFADRLHAALARLEDAAARAEPGSGAYECLDAQLDLLYQIAGASEDTHE